jgi:hypothetical protein
MSKLPRAIRALRASLRAASESGLRDRLEIALRGLERLYGLAPPPTPQDDDDMRRRNFVADRHPLIRVLKNRLDPWT